MSIVRRLLGFLTTPAPDPKPDEPVAAGFPEGEAIGEMWVSKLNAEGVWAGLRDISPLNRGYLNWAGQYELLVRYADVARARQILDLDDSGVPRERARSNHQQGR